MRPRGEKGFVSVYLWYRLNDRRTKAALQRGRKLLERCMHKVSWLDAAFAREGQIRVVDVGEAVH